MLKPSKIKSTEILPFHCPPGCLEEYLLRPNGKHGTIKLAVFHEHRNAFYYWLKWTENLNGIIPSLITFDWHQDLCPPYDDQLAGLKELDTKDNGNVAFYTWAKLQHTNDVQIYAAILLNKLKDVYVICRQETQRNNKMVIKDFEGNNHYVFIFKSLQEFEAKLVDIKDQQVYFDIDLDYFTLSNPTSVGCPFKDKRYTYLKKSEIQGEFSVSNPGIKWIMDRLSGFTIAMEPGFCGGLKKSNQLFHIIENLYFNGTLFNKYIGRDRLSWKIH